MTAGAGAGMSQEWGVATKLTATSGGRAGVNGDTCNTSAEASLAADVSFVASASLVHMCTSQIPGENQRFELLQASADAETTASQFAWQVFLFLANFAAWQCTCW